MNEVKKRIADIRKLEKDWNGYEASPIPIEVCDLAEKLLDELTYVPEVFPTGRQTIQFQWEKASNYAEVEIFLNKLSVLVDFNDKYYDFDLDISQFWIVKEISELIMNRENTE